MDFSPRLRGSMVMFFYNGLGPLRAYLLRHPDHIAHVLQNNHRNYHKSRLVQRVKPFLGEGLATSEGELWRTQRRLAQPSFHSQQIASLAAVVTNSTAEMLNRWCERAALQESMDVLTEMMQLTGKIIVRAMFGTELPSSDVPLKEDFAIVTQYTLERLLALTDWANWLPTAKRRRFRHALQRLDKVVWSIINARRQDHDNREDLLSMLMRARDAETGAQMSDQQMRDAVMTMFFAGHETTALALTWTWYLLAQYPEVEFRLMEEITGELGARMPTLEDLPHLLYTRMVIEESMRLYPPSWIISRAPVADDEIGGFRIPANSTVFLCQYLTHRHPDFWEAPDRFDPERFTPERSATRPRYAYFPFSGGARQCIGDQFAMMEAQLVVAMVAQKYRFEPIPGQRIEPQPLLTLRPRNGLRMRFAKRPA